MATRTKPYTLTGKPSAENIELADRMFGDLYEDLRSSSSHNLLSENHPDTTPASPPTRGDLVTAQGVAPLWTRFALGASNTVLRSNGTDTLWGQVVLTTDVTGTLPVTSGGTGIAAVVQGDILYGSAANTLAALAKNASATRYLSNTGVTNNPAWAQVALDTGVTGVLTVPNGGTGVATLSSGRLLLGGGTGAITVVGAIGVNRFPFNGGAGITASNYGVPNAAPAIGDIIYASTTTQLSFLLDVAVGSYLRSGGVNVAPVWSTATLPNTAVAGDLIYASATSVYSNLADVAVGSYLRSGGVTTAPVWSTIKLPNAAATADIWYGSAASTISALAIDTTATRYLANTGVANIPKWDQVALATGISGDLPFANLVQATGASILVGRGSAAGGGDFQEITLDSSMAMTGTVLSSTGGAGGLDYVQMQVFGGC